MRWSATFLWQFCIALDRCRSQACERLAFPFSSDLFCLFFERFPETILHVWMQMWGEMMLKRGMFEYPARISSDALELLANVDDHMFMMVPCPYTGLDW